MRSVVSADPASEIAMTCEIRSEGPAQLKNLPRSVHCKAQSVATLSEPICQEALDAFKQSWQDAHRGGSQDASLHFRELILGTQPELTSLRLQFGVLDPNAPGLPPILVKRIKEQGINSLVYSFSLTDDQPVRSSDLNWSHYDWQMRFTPGSSELQLETLVGDGQICLKTDDGVSVVIRNHTNPASPLRQSLAPFFKFINTICHPPK